MPFVGGRDAKTNPQILPRGRLAELVNRYQKRTGELTKAPNFVQHATNDLAQTDLFGLEKISRAFAIAAHRKRTLIHATRTGSSENYGPYSDTQILEYSPTASGWEALGHHMHGRVTVQGVAGRTDDYAQEIGRHDLAASDDAVIFAYEDYQLLKIKAYDRSAGAVLDLDSAITGQPTGPRVIYLSGASRFVVLAQRGTNKMRYLTVDEPDIWDSTAPSSDLVTDLHSDHVYDFVACGASACVLAYKESSSGHVILRYYDSTMTQQWTDTITEVSKGGIGITYSEDVSASHPIIVTWQDNATGNVRRQEYDTSGSALLSASTMTSSYTSDTLKHATMEYSIRDGEGVWFLEFEGTSSIENFVVIHTDTSAIDTVDNAALASKAFIADGGAKAWIIFDDSGQRSYQLLSRSGAFSHETSCRALYRRAHGVYSEHGIPSVESLGGGEYMTVCTRDDQLDEAGDVQESVVLLTLATDKDLVAPDIVEIGQEVVFGGPRLTSVQEEARTVGFPIAPVIKSTTTTTGSIAAGTYNVRFVYQYATGTGDVVRSAPSDPASQTLGGTGGISATLYLPPGLNGKVVTILAYRQPAGSTTYYLDSGNTIQVTSGTQVIAVTVADATLEANPQLYTSGGELTATAPPPATILAASRNKVLLVSDEDRQELWESKPKVRGVALEFSELLTVRVPAGGDVTGLSVLDGRFVVFQADAIYLLDGPGASSQGAGAYTPSSFQRISSQYGCTERRSILATDAGVYFKSRRGLELLTRSLEVVPIGHPVEDFDSETVVASVFWPAESQALFFLGDASGTILAYDQHHKAWSTWTRDDGVDEVTQHATSKEGVPVWITHGLGYDYDLAAEADSILVRELGSGYTSAANKVRTGWIRLAGLAGYKRVRRIGITGNRAASATGTLRIYQDDDDVTPTQTETLDGSTLDGRVRVETQKCRSIMIEYEETGSTEGDRLTGLSFEVAGKGGIFRHGAAETL